MLLDRHLGAHDADGLLLAGLAAARAPRSRSAIAGWVLLVLERPEIERRTRGSRALAIHLGVSAMLVWLSSSPCGLITDRRLLLAGSGRCSGSRSSRASTRRSSSRGASTPKPPDRGARDDPRRARSTSQETELRRIERDLHDGAQARLVALGMSLGMAEEKLATRPRGAPGAARRGADRGAGGARGAPRPRPRDPPADPHRPRARGGDRGRSPRARPLPVDVAVDLAERPRPPIETAAYFVVAEALANAVKYADAEQRRDRACSVDGRHARRRGATTTATAAPIPPAAA